MTRACTPKTKQKNTNKQTNKQTNKTQKHKTLNKKKNIKNATRGIGITEQKETGKQGRSDSIKQFTIQHQPTHHFMLKYVGGAATHLQNNVK